MTLLTSFGLGLVADVAVLVAHSDHDSGVFRPPDYRREDGAGSVIAGETGLEENRRGSVFRDQKTDEDQSLEIKKTTRIRLSRSGNRRGSDFEDQKTGDDQPFKIRLLRSEKNRR